jgi:MFS family permease
VAGDAQRATASRGAGSGFRSVFAEREFRWLWVAGVQSLVGDQLARVALSVLVFQRTDSTLLTAAVYALTFLPAFLGGLLLGGLADRYPRRRVLISCDLVRAGLVATMALPSMPLAAVGALLTLATMVGAPFKAAEPALLADIFNGERYVTALGLRTATYQSSQLAGFALGGVAVAAVGAHTALAVDATSFAISAAVLRWGLTARPAARAGAQGSAELTGYGVLEGIRLVARSRQLRLLLGLACLAGVWVIPEGLAVPYAAAVGGGAAATGWLLAANPAGNVVGALLISRLVRPDVRAGLVGPLAVAAGVPLVLCAFHPGLALTLVLWALAGVCSSYQVPLIAEYVDALPDGRRGQAMGLASAALLAVQGVGLLAGGALAQGVGVVATIAISGGVGGALALWMAISRSKDRLRAESTN